MKRVIFIALFLLLIGWVLTDLLFSHKVDLRHFDADEVGRLDGVMWRSYYERKPLRLFWQSAELIRKQVQAPFWRSFVIAYHAAKAAFVFKDGTSRTEYNRALPDLEAFYGAIGKLSQQPMNVAKTAKNELEWWIIRRERDRHPPAEWAQIQAHTVADLYQISPASCAEYAQLRTEAMLFRDQRGNAITEQDWQHIDALLKKSWRSLAEAVR
ncbi:hypothetical protein GCM10027592_08560 [Spirosoma flavus]